MTTHAPYTPTHTPPRGPRWLLFGALPAIATGLGGWAAARRWDGWVDAREARLLREYLSTSVAAGAPGAASLFNPRTRALAELFAATTTRARELIAVAEKRIETLEPEARRTAHLRTELEQLASIVAHQLHEPLIRVTTYLDMLGRHVRGKLDAPGTRFLTSVHAGAKRIEALIEDITLYARTISAPPDRYDTDTAALVRTILLDLDIEIIESGAQISVGALPSIQANPDEIARVFRHLITNAIRFRRGESPHIAVNSTRTDAATLFTVADDGIGIDPHHQRTLFSVSPRLHTDTAYIGSGIGLAICKKVVEHHGGSLWVESTPGVGSTFTFSIPDIPPRPPSEPENRPRAER
jgi:light-regulated signal transduction histidine kinase (bacteriophytochrome)